MEAAIVDANVFLRFLLKDNPTLHRQALLILTKAKEGKIELLVPSTVIFEISFVLNSVYKFTKEEIIHNIESLLSVKYLSIDELVILNQAVTLYKTSNNSLVDCLLLQKAKSQGIKLLTFDKKLSKLL